MLEIEVLTPGGTGIFGLVARKARIRVRLKEKPPGKMAERVPEAAPPAIEEAAPEEAAPEEAAPEEAAPPTGEEAEAAPEAVEAGAEPEKKPSARAERLRRRREAIARQKEARAEKRRRREEEARRVAAEEGPEAPEVPEEAMAPPEAMEPTAGEEPVPVPEHIAEEAAPEEPEEPLPVPDEETAARARETLKEMVRGMGYEGLEVQSSCLPGEVRLEVRGEEAAELIGRRGEVLSSLQYLVNKIINRATQGRIPVIVDAEGYRDKRRSTLEEMALKMAAKAKTGGRPVSLAPLNAHDRRIVHLTLQTDEEIRTKSKGEGAMRKVVIYPRKRRRGGNKGTQSEG
jgi:spoIIIJ-associated protein